MSVEWGEYSPFDPGVTQPLPEVSKKQARAAFKRLMAAKPERVAELSRLLDANGVALTSDDAGLQRVNDWFREEVEGDPATGRLHNMWYSIVNDTALFLGDVMIERAPNLAWVMFEKGARDAAFQRHVIMGFTGVANPKYNVDVDLLLATYGHRIIGGQAVEADAFVSWVRAAVAKA